MIKLGEKQALKVVKKVEFGVYLADMTDTEERVLLPAKQVPEGTVVGSEVALLMIHKHKLK